MLLYSITNGFQKSCYSLMLIILAESLHSSNEIRSQWLFAMVFVYPIYTVGRGAHGMI